MQTTTANSSTTITPETTPIEVDADKVHRLLTKRSFATLATTSEAGWPHSAGVLYEIVGGAIYINTMRSSRKAKNIAANPRVSVCVPVRRLPVGPPSSIHFQAMAEILALDHPDIVHLVNQGELKSLTSHGELELEDGCFVRIHPGRRMLTYGLGLSLTSLIKDPLSAAGVTDYSSTRTG